MGKVNSMVKFCKHLFNACFDEDLDLRERSFNLLGLTGIAAGIVVALLSMTITNGSMTNVLVNLSTSVVAFFLLLAKSKKRITYHVVAWFIIVVVFIILFPVLFFTAGGYRSGTPSFFMLAIIFTAIMLADARKRTIVIVLELAVYIACCLTAYYWPASVMPFETEADYVFDLIMGLTVSSVMLTAVVLLHLRMYTNRQIKIMKLNQELEEQNVVLSRYDKMKTEFLQDIEHEIQNPLTIISLGADFAHSRIEAQGGAADEVHNALNVVQSEAVRLGGMINAMVVLAVMGDNLGQREKIDFAVMLQKCAETARFALEKKANILRMTIAPDLPHVYAKAEQLERVLDNILANAIRHTDNGCITIETSFNLTYITVTIRDTGSGIEREVLSRVFERGVSFSGSSGYGLAICKIIVEAHGGEISIESQSGQGTAVTFTIPVYGGQSEVDGCE